MIWDATLSALEFACVFQSSNRIAVAAPATPTPSPIRGEGRRVLGRGKQARAARRGLGDGNRGRRLRRRRFFRRRCDYGSTGTEVHGLDLACSDRDRLRVGARLDRVRTGIYVDGVGQRRRTDAIAIDVDLRPYRRVDLESAEFRSGLRQALLRVAALCRRQRRRLEQVLPKVFRGLEQVTRAQVALRQINEDGGVLAERVGLKKRRSRVLVLPLVEERDTFVESGARRLEHGIVGRLRASGSRCGGEREREHYATGPHGLVTSGHRDSRRASKRIVAHDTATGRLGGILRRIVRCARGLLCTSGR